MGAVGDLCLKVAEDHTPSDIPVKYIDDWKKSVCVMKAPDTSPLGFVESINPVDLDILRIEVPKPTNRLKLFVYLHECGHVQLKHNENFVRALYLFGCSPNWTHEIEAHHWAANAMLSSEVPLPHHALYNIHWTIKRLGNRDATKTGPAKALKRIVNLHYKKGVIS